MSENLRKQLKKLIKLSKAKITDIRKSIKKSNRNFIRALSEIAYNVKQGVLTCKKYSRSRVIATLADKNKPYTLKQKVLRSFSAAEVIKTLILSAIPILTSLAING